MDAEQPLRDEKPRRTPNRCWLLKWLRDESFCRDITSKILSALIVTAIVWLSGIALGYFQGPDLMRRSGIAFLTVLYAGGAGTFALLAFGAFRRKLVWMGLIAPTALCR